MTHFELRPEPLLSRERFKALVFSRARGCCCFCAMPAVDPHHILDRKLYNDGGYYLSNGAAVCDAHHWQCETTVLSVAAVRIAARVDQVVLPPSLARLGFAASVDKWGNQILEGPWSGYRVMGPLRNDTGMHRALAAGGFSKWLLPEAPASELNGEQHEME